MVVLDICHECLCCVVFALLLVEFFVEVVVVRAVVVGVGGGDEVEHGLFGAHELGEAPEDEGLAFVEGEELVWGEGVLLLGIIVVVIVVVVVVVLMAAVVVVVRIAVVVLVIIILLLLLLILVVLAIWVRGGTLDLAPPQGVHQALVGVLSVTVGIDAEVLVEIVEEDDGASNG